MVQNVESEKGQGNSMNLLLILKYIIKSLLASVYTQRKYKSKIQNNSGSIIRIPQKQKLRRYKSAAVYTMCFNNHRRPNFLREQKRLTGKSKL